MSVDWGFEECGFAEESLGTLERNVGMMKIIGRLLVPRGWKGERKKLKSGEWEWEFRISKEGWEFRLRK